MISEPEQSVATGGKVWVLPPTEKPSGSTNGMVTLSVNINKETAAALKKIAVDNGITITEAVRRAVSVADFMYKEKAKGRHIQTMTKRGRKVRDVYFQ